jgi:tellurite resistance protein TerC
MAKRSAAMPKRASTGHTMVIWLWVGFILFILGMLAIDLGVLNREAHRISAAEALAWSALCVALALAFNVAVYYIYDRHWCGIGATIGQQLSGKDAAIQFLTGYLIEQSLSLDNIFVFAVIFAYFRVPDVYQHRVLFWGIMGALIMRGIMIAAGAALIHRFDWIIYVFGGLLILTAVKMLLAGDQDIEPDRNPLVRLARKLYPVTPTYEGEHFFSRINGRRAITPLFLVLLVVESTDVLFAVDSIPAIFAVTTDSFLVFTSNVFAILNLRSLYFALASIMHKFRYLKVSLVFVLAFVGVKMLLSHHYPIDTLVSLSVVAGILAVGIVGSMFPGHRPPGSAGSPGGPSQTVVEQVGELAVMTWKQARRVAIILVGASVLLIGVAMLVLPGPAMIVIPLGLAILGIEFAWARRILKRLKQKAASLASAAGFGNKPNP